MEATSWLSAVSALVIGLFGGGGISAFIKARADKKQGISQHELAKDDAVARRWQEIVKAQTESLVAPLREAVGELEEKVDHLEAELEQSRKKYWNAIGYIRTLLTWIARHLHGDDNLEDTVPTAPANLVEDI